MDSSLHISHANTATYVVLMNTGDVEFDATTFAAAYHLMCSAKKRNPEEDYRVELRVQLASTVEFNL